MEQFEQPVIVVELLQGRHRRMTEPAIGRGDHLLQIGIGNGACDERRHDREGHLLVGAPAQLAEVMGRDLRPARGHIEAAVAGQTGQQHIFKAKLRSLAPGRNIAQDRSSS